MLHLLPAPKEIRMDEGSFSLTMDTCIAGPRVPADMMRTATAQLRAEIESAYVTGYGKADKKQIQQMVKLLLNMQELPKPDDAADAIACAITHCQAGRMREQFRMK